MVKEFDIYLRDRLVEWDLLVYSIPYRDGISATNRLVLGAALNGYLMKKVSAANMGLETDAHIDRMIKLCLEKLRTGVGLEAVAEIEKRAKLYLGNSPITIGIPAVAMTERQFNKAGNGLLLSSEPLAIQFSTSTGRISLPLAVDTSVGDTLKRDLLCPRPAITPDAKIIEFNQADFICGSASIPVSSTLQSLCYQATGDADSAMELMTLLLDAEILHSLGKWYDVVTVGSKVTGTWGRKFISAQPGMAIKQSAEGGLTKVLYPDESGVTIDVPNIEISMKCYRTLYETGETLSDLDNMSLNDIDYIIR